ncbi:MAG: hypothetical protein IT285_07445 [Bdellovibrionales bacterium]|nr:hypothetical protein [Bdellovibrionales bacterium]
MSEFQESDYSPILLTAIRRGVVLPFDCYLLLRANGRIVRYVAAGEAFPEGKLERLWNHQVRQLHIHVRDQGAYETYVRGFLESAEGKAAVAELARAGDLGKVEGVPESLAATFEAIVAEAPPVAEALGDVAQEEIPAAEPESAESAEEPVEKPAEVPAAPVEPPSEALSQHGRIIQVLQGGVEYLGGRLRVVDTLTGEEKETIRSVTDRIQSDIQKARGAKGGEEAVQIIHGVTLRIQDELTRVKGLLGDDPDRMQAVKPHLERVNRQLAMLDQASRAAHERKDGAAPSQLMRIAGRAWDEVQTDIRAIRNLSEPKDLELVQGSLTAMVQGLEEVLGAKLSLGSGSPGTGIAGAARFMDLVDQVHGGATRVAALARAAAGELPSASQEVQSKAALLKELVAQVEPSAAGGAVGGGGARGSLVAAGEAGAGGGGGGAKGSLKGQSIHEGEGGAAPAGTSASWSASGGGPVDPRLAAVVNEQNRTIKELVGRLRSAKGIYTMILKKWEDLKATGAQRFSDAERSLAEDLSTKIQGFGETYLGTEIASRSLISLNLRLGEITGVKAEGVGEIQIKEKAENSDEGEGGEPGLKSSKDLQLPPESGANASAEELRSENKILRVQVQNAKALLESCEKKIHELSRLHEDGSGYADSIEKELAALTEEYEKIRVKYDDAEGRAHRSVEAAEASARDAYQAKQEASNKDEIIRDLNSKLDTLESELKNYRGMVRAVGDQVKVTPELLEQMDLPPEARSQLREQEAALRRYESEMENKRGELRQLRKELARQMGKAQENALFKKQMSQKFDKIKLDVDMARGRESGLNRKVIMVTNLLDDSRRSISKLTQVNEELRADRMEYMNRTNQALRDYKDMMSKANTLDRHVQAEIQRGRSLVEQNETLKSKLREISTRFADLQKEFKSLEGDHKRMKRLIDGSDGSAPMGGGENSPIVLQRKLDALEQEKRTLAKWYADEKKKSGQLAAQIKKMKEGAGGGQAA